MSNSTSYLLGVATPLAVALAGLLSAYLVERYRTRRIGFEHKGCGGYHEFRYCLPKPFLRRIAMPISVWRCNRGQMVPLLPWFSQGRDRSNDPEDEL